VSIEPELTASTEKDERRWLPVVIAAAIVLLIATVVILDLELKTSRSSVGTAPITAPLDPYASSLVVSHLAMSESTNLIGGKVTYLDGQIANRGGRTVTGITVQVLFRDFAHEVAQNESQSLKLIRTREPYIDVEPLSAAPLRPGDQRDFRLIFGAVSPEWDSAYPEIRILRVATK
jgi:hypothetical protein